MKSQAGGGVDAGTDIGNEVARTGRMDDLPPPVGRGIRSSPVPLMGSREGPAQHEMCVSGDRGAVTPAMRGFWWRRYCETHPPMIFVVLRYLSRNAWKYIMALTLTGVRHLISPRWLEKM